jgi:hypothetical protein
MESVSEADGGVSSIEPEPPELAVVDLPHALQRRNSEFKPMALGDFTELYPLRFQCAAYCPFIASV